MTVYSVIATIVVAALLAPLAIILIRFNRKQLHIIRCARSATEEQLETVYRLLERLTPEPTCFVLARTNRQATDEALIPVPLLVKPWGGRVISITNGADLSFKFVESAALEPRLRGKVFRTVPMPPTSEADWDNVESVFVRLTEEHPQLKAALGAVCPAYPAELLQHLLSGVETFELDPMNQVQLGGDPAWVQDEAFPSCDHCRKQMSLILQMPGTLMPGRTNPRGTFFFFGCALHPDHTKTVAQFT